MFLTLVSGFDFSGDLMPLTFLMASSTLLLVDTSPLSGSLTRELVKNVSMVACLESLIESRALTTGVSSRSILARSQPNLSLAKSLTATNLGMAQVKDSLLSSTLGCR